MKTSSMKTLLRGAAVAALASFPLMAAEVSPDSGAGTFYALILGLMATIFGGMAFCYGLVELAEKIVHTFHARHAVPIAVPPIRHAA
jgi:spore maturation protein SpmB